MTVRFSPLHKWEGWKVLATGFGAGVAFVLVTIGLAVLGLRLAGVGS